MAWGMVLFLSVAEGTGAVFLAGGVAGVAGAAPCAKDVETKPATASAIRVLVTCICVLLDGEGDSGQTDAAAPCIH